MIHCGKSVPDEVKIALNKGNEDFFYVSEPNELPTGQLFVVGDFMATTFPDVGEQAVFSIKEILKRIAKLPPRHLLSQLANDLDKLMKNAAQGRHNIEFTLAAGAISDGNMLHYLTIGDCGINIYREGSLQLLNGSSWKVPFMVVEEKHEATGGGQAIPWPPSRTMKVGRGSTFIQARDVENFQLEKQDLVLLFSDGIERNLSPVDRLRLVEETAKLSSANTSERDEGIKDPKSLVTRTLSEAQQRGGGDDCTLVVVAGPFEHKTMEVIEHMQSRLHDDLRDLHGQIDKAFHTMEELKANTATLSQVRSITEGLDQLKSSLKILKDSANKQHQSVSTSIDGYKQLMGSLIAAVGTLKLSTASLPTFPAHLDEVRNTLAGSLSEISSSLFDQIKNQGETFKTALSEIRDRLSEMEKASEPPAATPTKATFNQEDLRAELNNLKAGWEQHLGEIQANLIEGFSSEIKQLQIQPKQDGHSGYSSDKDLPAGENEEEYVPVKLVEDESLAKELSLFKATVEQHLVSIQELMQKVDTRLNETQEPVTPTDKETFTADRETVDETGDAASDGTGDAAFDGDELPADIVSPDPDEQSPDAAAPPVDSPIQLRLMAAGRWLAKHKKIIFKVGIGTILVVIVAGLAAIIIKWMIGSWSSSGDRPQLNANRDVNANNNTAPAGNNFKIAIRADGRSLFIIRPQSGETRLKAMLNLESFPERSGETLMEFETEEQLFNRLKDWEKYELIVPDAQALVKGKPELSVYVVQGTDVKNAATTDIKGDVCQLIAAQKGLKPDDIKKYNPKADCYRLQAGDVLVIGKAPSTNRRR